jgi:hypothetical protein
MRKRTQSNARAGNKKKMLEIKPAMCTVAWYR